MATNHPTPSCERCGATGIELLDGICGSCANDLRDQDILEEEATAAQDAYEQGLFERGLIDEEFH